MLDPLLFDIRILLPELVGESERDHGQTSSVQRRVVLVLESDRLLGGSEKRSRGGDLSVNVGKDGVVLRVLWGTRGKKRQSGKRENVKGRDQANLESSTEGPGILEIGENDPLVTVKSEVEEVEVLTDDRMCWSREVESERELGAAEVVQLESTERHERRSGIRSGFLYEVEGLRNEGLHEFLGQERLVPPDAAREEEEKRAASIPKIKKQE